MGDDLRQADLSHLSLKDMTPEQRAELRRRLDFFIAKVAKPRPAASEPKKPTRKWVPGMKS